MIQKIIAKQTKIMYNIYSRNILNFSELLFNKTALNYLKGEISMIQKLKKFGAVVLSLGLAAANLPTFPVNAAGVTDLYVGYASKANNFATVQEAVNKAASYEIEIG